MEGEKGREADAELLPLKRRDPFLSFACLGILLFSIIFIPVASSLYARRIEKIAFSESRYITVEWGLLKQLKMQTDYQLLEKDREIADLKRQYLILASGESSSARLQEVALRLEQAQSEREALAGRTKEGAPMTPLLAIPLKGAEEGDATPSMTELLLKRVQTLEAQLSEGKAREGLLERDLASLKAPAPNPLTVASPQAGMGNGRELGDKADLLEKEMGRAVDDLLAKKAGIPGTSGLSLDEVKAWTLLKALADSPTIRDEYPGLLASVEGYFDASIREANRAGMLEGLGAGIEAIGDARKRAAAR